MKIDVLLSCMHQRDRKILGRTRIFGDAVVVNQCGISQQETIRTPWGRVTWLDSDRTGLSRSRNMAIAASDADVCLLCDDDEVFEPDYRQIIRNAYRLLPKADVIVFKIRDRNRLPDRVMPLRFPRTFHVASWQISFRRERIVAAGVGFDVLLGAGTGNGAEEELKFLMDCERKGLRIYYVPRSIARVSHRKSTWFTGFNETFFYNRGASTRYILGFPLAAAYGVYYVLRKRRLYCGNLTTRAALRAVFRGMAENKITKQARKEEP